MTKMNPEVKAKWVAALRSGEYKQGKGELRSADDEFCCLGVLCDLKGSGAWVRNPNVRDAWGYDFTACFDYPPEAVLTWAGAPGGATGPEVLIGGILDSVAEHNDKQVPFSVIADAIEAQL